jgi:hypothetical protein
MDDDTEVEMIELLGDEYADALLGAVFEDDGTPVPCYSSAAVMDYLLLSGHDEDSALAAVEEATEGMKMLWVHPLELEVEFVADDKPHLTLVPSKKDLH